MRGLVPLKRPTVACESLESVAIEQEGSYSFLRPVNCNDYIRARNKKDTERKVNLSVKQTENGKPICLAKWIEENQTVYLNREENQPA